MIFKFGSGRGRGRGRGDRQAAAATENHAKSRGRSRTRKTPKAKAAKAKSQRKRPAACAETEQAESQSHIHADSAEIGEGSNEEHVASDAEPGDTAPHQPEEEELSPDRANPPTRKARARAKAKVGEAKVRAKAKPKATTRKRATAKSKAKSGPKDEPNPFTKAPDADQESVKACFGFSDATPLEHHQRNQPQHQGQHPKKKARPSNPQRKSCSTSSSSSSSSSSAPSQDRFAAFLSDFVDDGQHNFSPNRSKAAQQAHNRNSPEKGDMRPEQMRTRKEMFSFVDRHLRRMHQHFGRESLLSLDEHLSNMSLLTLYSGLGGAEISAGLTFNGLQKLKQQEKDQWPENFASTPPSFELACDYNTDCQKVLRNHVATWLHWKHIAALPWNSSCSDSDSVVRICNYTDASRCKRRHKWIS